MRNIYGLFYAAVLTILSISIVHAQDVGVGTDTPDAPFHVHSSGQVHVPGGLVLFGNRSEAHMELDFNRIQSLFGMGGATIPLLLQQEGGDVGIGVDMPDSRLHIAGTTDQFLTLQKTTVGSGEIGINLLRGNEFSATDWRIMNDGGILKFLDGTDNFMTDGDLNMMISQSGNVGLGTDSPASHLHIAGPTDQFLTIHRTTSGTGQAGIDLLRSVGASATDWRITNDGGVLKFYDNTDNFDTEGDLNMVITQSGNVGIGITSPGAPLNVNGTEFISETGDGHMQVGNPSGTHLRFDNNEILARNNNSPSTLFLQYWSGNLALCSDPAGRVGIGNSTPVAKLHITGGTDVGLGGGGFMVMGPTTGTNIAMDGNEIQARDNGAGAGLYLQADGGDVLLIPNELGQVGIGITNPANLPDAQYLLAVDGKVVAEEVRVELSGAWPDYVFENDYALRPLPALENEIQKLGHLPGVPSAMTVENEGFELGDMQRIMMEKIEELTLYVIDLDKEVNALRKRNRELEEKIGEN